MNILSRDKQIAVISALTEGCSIRSVERLTGIHRDTIMRLGVRVGEGCAALHDDMMQFVQVNRLELDELWSYVGKKQRQIKETDPADLGDQYVFLGIDGSRKAIISYRVGKRDAANTHAFLADLRCRIVNQPEISSDGFFAYPNAVEAAFGADCTFAQIIKQYHGEPTIDTARRYSPGVVVGVEYRRVIGQQAKISTSYVERGNLSVRMGSVHAVDQCLQQEANEPRRRCQLVRGALQPLPRSRSAADHASDGNGRHRSRLEHRRIGRCGDRR